MLLNGLREKEARSLRRSSAARWAVPGRGSCCGGRRRAPTPLWCSPRGRAAKLASFASLSTLEQSRRVRSRSARCARADRAAALLAAPEIAPTGYRPTRSTTEAFIGEHFGASAKPWAGVRRQRHEA